jgi:hypothetical protein
MKRTAGSPDLFQRLLRETDESAALALLIELCRASPVLRLWLFEEFAREDTPRAQFSALLREKSYVPTRFSDLDGGGAAWRQELDALRNRFAGQTYGGLTFDQLKELIVRHQAGQGDAAAYLLALEWRRHGRNGTLPPRLVRAACDFLTAGLAPGGAELLRQLARAVELVNECASPGRWRAALGFSDWWKLSVLLYMMRHPAPAYRTRDVQQHLSGQRLRVSSRALRQFCAENGIARDMRAGRPKPARLRTAPPQRGKAGSATRRAAG